MKKINIFSIDYYNFFLINAALKGFFQNSVAREQFFLGELAHELHKAAEPCVKLISLLLFYEKNTNIIFKKHILFNSSNNYSENSFYVKIL